MNARAKYFEMGEMLAGRGVATLAFDMCGHGESEGKRYHVVIRKWVAALRAALDFVQADRRIDGDRLGAFGISSGGTTILETALVDPRLKEFRAANPQGDDRTRWFYQIYMKDYLRCVASVDDNIGRFLDYLDKSGLAENTIVIYTSDQGFFLGEHNFFDKRFMYEESLRMPFLMRWPERIKSGTVSKGMILNVDFAPMLLDAAGVTVPGLVPLCGHPPAATAAR